jgi:polyribonucleotide nucleotidyltransferase
MGDVFQVKYLGMDPKTRKKKVSRKLMPKTSTREDAKNSTQNLNLF